MAWLIFVWLGIALVCIIVEFILAKLISVWFAIGSISAMIIWACSLDWYIQVIVFVAVSVASLFGLRKFTLMRIEKRIAKTAEKHDTETKK